jgi:BolA protein
MSLEKRIEERLAALAPEALEIVDRSAEHAGHAGARGGGHFQLVIVSAAFAGQPLQQRHRMVYEALAPLLQKEIHALAIQAYAPGEL